MSVQPSSTTLFGVPSPTKTTQGPRRWIQQLIMSCTTGMQDMKATSANQLRGPKAKPSRPTNSIRSDCHLRAMDSGETPRASQALNYVNTNRDYERRFRGSHSYASKGNEKGTVHRGLQSVTMDDGAGSNVFQIYLTIYFLYNCSLFRRNLCE